ncbi:MAG: hypothetical protein Q9163_004573 [Psora crenata]
MPRREERIARVVWAAYILSYLSKQRRHRQLQPPDLAGEEEEEEGFEGSELDAVTERTAVLQEPRESIRSKFLDCIAQLLSPSKGWESVTATALREREDFVEVDIARNDCFNISMDGRPDQHAYEFGRAEADYCRKLEHDLSTATHQASFSEFELLAISYTSRRVDYWVEQLRASLNSASVGPNWDSQRWFRHLSAIETWMAVIELLRAKNFEGIKFRESFAQRAYDCVGSADLHGLLHIAFDGRMGSKVWCILRFIARPITDCRMLRSIASQFPQFRDIRISPVVARPKESLSPEYRIDISEAWARLELAPPSSEQVVTSVLGEKFKQNCAATCDLHAEIQLFTHYEDSPALNSTLSYFGCSKKACLLCDTFLRALPDPITTRGCHGICYPAWGIPPPRSVRAESGLKELEIALVSLIKSILDKPVRNQKTHFASPIKQSTFVSDFTNSTSEDLLQREEKVKLAKEAERVRINERFIREGAAVTSPPLDGSHPDFEPHDSCVMCNTSPAKPCKSCRSCYYCCPECQKADSPSHELLCKSFSTQDPRPSRDHRRAMFFPEDCTEPRMVWLSCERKVSQEDYGVGASYEIIDFYPYLGMDRPYPGTMRIEHNPIRDRNLGSGMAAWAPRKDGYSVSLKYRDAYLEDGSAVNKSVLKSAGASGGTTPYSWRGPIVAVRQTPFEKYEDITMGDFRHIIDYLMSYRTTELRESARYQEGRLPTSIRGVKICCYGEIKLHSSEPYVSVDVPRAHAIRLIESEAEVSSISKLLGMPLKLWKYPDIDAWNDPPGWSENMTSDSNPNAAFLMMETDLKNPGWGFAPRYWNTDLGNVLAVRLDDKDLDVDDVKIMCYFARRKLQRLFEDALGGGYVQRTKEDVRNFITRENMMEWWHKIVNGYGIVSDSDESNTF